MVKSYFSVGAVCIFDVDSNEDDNTQTQTNTNKRTQLLQASGVLLMPLDI